MIRLVVGVLAVFSLAAFSCNTTAPPAASVCTQGTNGEDPVVIVGGTFSPEFANQAFLGNRLASEGYTYCVFELMGSSDFGDLPGTAPIEVSADQLALFVADVLAWSGAPQVDLVGHSQGALVARYYLKFDGGTPYVNDMVSLAGPNDGTDVAALVALFADAVLAPFGTSCALVQPCVEMQQNSAVVNDLNSGDATPGSVDYYAFGTKFDSLVWTQQGLFRNHDNAFIDGATNRYVQDECWLRVTGHLGMILDEVVYEMTTDALTGQSVNVPLWKCALPTFPL
jgi:triacylglycerol esterase/lipase EstA (alpha/beta hydrolase family)